MGAPIAASQAGSEPHILGPHTVLPFWRLLSCGPKFHTAGRVFFPERESDVFPSHLEAFADAPGQEDAVPSPSTRPSPPLSAPQLLSWL